MLLEQYGDRRRELRILLKLIQEKLFLRRRARLAPHGARRILAIACTGHGASLAYIGDNGVVRSSVLDRWVGVKHVILFSGDEEKVIRNPKTKVDKIIKGVFEYGFGRFPEFRIFEEVLPAWVEWLLQGLNVTAKDIDLVVTSDSHFATNFVRLGFDLSHWFPAATIFRLIEHHEIHQRQAFWQSGFKEAAVLTLDTCGEELRRIGKRKLSGTISLMNERGECSTLKEMLFPESSPGAIYDIVNHHVGFRQGDEGKTMGLAPYGRPVLFTQLRRELRLHDDGSFAFMPHADFAQRLNEYVPERQAGEQMTERHEEVAYAGQALLELIVANAFKAALRMTGMRDLAYAGGVALNSVANEVAYRAARPRRLYVATNPGDTGHALGCALFGAYELAGWKPTNRELPEYLGPDYSNVEITRVATSNGYSENCRPYSDEVAARCIANGHIVARFDGGAEFGPRALGNRSILCDPRRTDMKDYLNRRVKRREPFRPFAPTVLEDQASKWFDLDERSSYMLRVVPVRPEVAGRIPAVIHIDGTARVQTLSRVENQSYWRLISAFHRMTGVPLVLNTSFNVAGRPIVETPAHALECFASTEIDVLILGPRIISKRPIEEYLRESR